MMRYAIPLFLVLLTLGAPLRADTYTITLDPAARSESATPPQCPKAGDLPLEPTVDDPLVEGNAERQDDDAEQHLGAR